MKYDSQGGCATLALVILVTACGGTGDGRARGPSDFRSPTGSVALAGGTGARGADLGSTGAPPVGAPAQGSGGTAQLVEEGDIVKLAGSTLLVLNRYRGLQMVDVSSAAAPALLSRVAVAGEPLDMYLRGATVLALVSGHRSYEPCASCPGGARMVRGSRLAAVDISDPRAAALSGSVEIAGAVSDSRLVGDVLYVVSHQYAFYQPLISDDGRNTTTVQAFDVTIPARPVLRAELQIPRGGWSDHVHVTDRLLYLASTGHGQYAGGVCTLPAPGKPGTAEPGGAARPPVVTPAGPCTRLTVVDIAAPGGEIELGATADLQGSVLDRWSMDSFGGVLRVVVSGGTVGGRFEPPHITTFRSPDAGTLERLGDLPLTLPRPEQVTAVRFDGERGYVVTFERIDPLFTLDLSDPARPRVAGVLETPGWVDHVEPRGRWLLALGHHQAAAPQPGAATSWSLAASLYDVRDLERPVLAAREVFGEGAGFIPGRRDDWHKVFRVIDAERLILMPYRTLLLPTDDLPWRKAERGGVQLFDFDLERGMLAKRGRVEHDGSVERALSDGRDHLLAVSGERLQIADIADRSSPRPAGGLDLARNVRDVLAVGDAAVVVVEDGAAGETRLLSLPAGDPNGPSPRAALGLPVTEARLFSSGRFVYVVGTRPTAGKEASLPVLGPGQGTTVLVVEAGGAGLRKRGELVLPTWVPLGRWSELGGLARPVVQVAGTTLALNVPRTDDCLGGSGSGSGATPPVRGGSSGGAATGGAASGTDPGDAGAAPDAPFPPEATTASQRICAPPEMDFLVVDLADPDRPSIASRFVIPGAAAVAAAGANGSTLFVDHVEQVPGLDARNQVTVAALRYFVTRVDLAIPARPSLGPKINVPGAFLLERSDDRTWIAVEPRRDESSGRTSLVLSTLYQPAGAAKAYLEGQLELAGSGSGGLVVGPRSAFTVAEGELVSIDLAQARTPRVAARLTIPGVAAGAGGGGVGVGVAVPGGGAGVTFSSGWASVRALGAGHLLVAVDGGVLLYDVRDVTRPALVGFRRSWGGGDVLREGAAAGTLYAPLGWGGVEVVVERR